MLSNGKRHDCDCDTKVQYPRCRKLNWTECETKKKENNKKTQLMQIKNSHHTLIMYALQKNEQKEEKKNGYNCVLWQ